MTSILVKFWLLRFAQVFLAVGAALALLEALRPRGAGFDWVAVAGWATLTALLRSF